MVLSHSGRHLNLAILIFTTLSISLAMAEPVSTTAEISTNPTPATASIPESKLVSSFTPMAGSTENSTSLVKGLRSGTPIVLTSPSSTPGAPENTVTFNSPTRPMGYGNVRIALSLAKTQLASEGITQPTPEQLQGALIGTQTGIAGSTTTQQGILQMRASGMGWGQIANSMGVKLGTVMSGKTPTTTTATTIRTVNATGSKSTSSPGGVTTAAGVQGKHSGTTTAEGAKSSGSSKGITTSQGHSNSAAASGGAVNAAGSRAGGIGSAAGANAGHSSGGKKP